MARHRIFILFCMEHLTDQICFFLHDFQKPSFPCDLIIGHRSLHKMPCRIELVALLQVTELFSRIENTKVGVQISIFLLSPSYKFNGLICHLLQLWIWFIGKRISHRFQPFGQIRILKNKAFKGSFRLLCRHTKILHTMAFLCVRYGII